MNCWHCKGELIWGGDHDLNEDEDFATRYREGTVYKPMQKMGVNF